MPKCARCGVFSTWDKAFSEPTGRRCCPPCAATLVRRSMIRARIGMLFLFAVFTYGVFFSREPDKEDLEGRIYLWLFTVAFYGIVFYRPIAIVHEFGKAVGALHLGFKVFSLKIGNGRPLRHFTLLGIPIELTWSVNAVPSLQMAYPKKEGLARNKALAFLWGPLFNLPFIAAIWLLIGLPLHDALPPNRSCAPLHAYAILSLGFALVCFSKAESARRWTEKTVEVFNALYYFESGMLAGVASRYDEAAHWARQGLEVYPESALLHMVAGLAHFWQRDFSRSLGHLKLVLADPDFADQFETMILPLRLIVMADLLIEPALPQPAQDKFCQEGLIDDPLEEADRLSQGLCEQVPWDADVLATRGCVLIALGRCDEGLPLVDLQTRGQEKWQALCSCFVALAAAKTGSFDQAESCLEAARQMDEDCPAFTRIDREIQAMAARPLTTSH